MIRKFSKLVVVALAAAAFLASMPARAQTPSTSAPPFQPSTFVAAANFAAPQTGAGDLFCITGSASRLIKVKQITISGIKTTAQTALFNLVKRSAADTGGTSAAATAVPLDTSQAVAPATATVLSYTAVPAPGTAVGNVGSRYLGFFAGSVGTVNSASWTWRPADLFSDVRLRGAAQQLCLNAPAAFTTDGPTLSVEVTWTEQ